MCEWCTKHNDGPNIFHKLGDWWSKYWLALVVALICVYFPIFLILVGYSGGYKLGCEKTHAKYRQLVKDGRGDLILEAYNGKQQKAQTKLQEALDELDD